MIVKYADKVRKVIEGLIDDEQGGFRAVGVEIRSSP